ncbi:hypothetical protein L1887_21655 [Cichorium endivia]|nr:hypothetical protein L1887_21655 [Cichorium endivia]
MLTILAVDVRNSKAHISNPNASKTVDVRNSKVHISNPNASKRLLINCLLGKGFEMGFPRRYRGVFVPLKHHLHCKRVEKNRVRVEFITDVFLARCYELVEEFGYFICWGCVRRKNGRGWYSTSSSFIYVQHNRRRKISRRPSDGQETKLAVSKHKFHSTSATTTVPTKVNPKFRRASEQLEP